MHSYLLAGRSPIIENTTLGESADSDRTTDIALAPLAIDGATGTPVRAAAVVPGG